MKITSTEIKHQVNHVNNYVLENSIYRIEMQRHSGCYWLYLHSKDEERRRLRTLTSGNAREINAYLTAFQHIHWYMQSPF